MALVACGVSTHSCMIFPRYSCYGPSSANQAVPSSTTDNHFHLNKGWKQANKTASFTLGESVKTFLNIVECVTIILLLEKLQCEHLIVNHNNVLKIITDQQFFIQYLLPVLFFKITQNNKIKKFTWLENTMSISTTLQSLIKYTV